MRLFVGLYPPQEALADLPQRSGREHVTLAFLGEVPDPAELLAELPSVQDLPAPRLRLAGAGRFRGGAVWLGLRGDLAALERLHARVREAVAAAGLPAPTGPWRPHLTVGRGHVLPALTAYEGPYALWRSVALVRSTLGRDGARHEPRATWYLGGPAPGVAEGEPGKRGS